MAYNPYFPQNYPYQPQMQTKYVEAIPVDTIAEAENCPMAAGSSGVFFAKDDSFIAVKSITVNGQKTFEVYDKRPPAPPAPVFDPTLYVTREELEARIAAISAVKSKGKKGDEE